MNKKKVILLILLILLIVLGIYITILYFSDNIVDEKSDIANNNEQIYTVSNLPIDNEYDDNKQLYGGWSSEKTEIFRDNRLSATVIDNKKVIQIYNNDKLDVCYVDDNTELVCETSNYSFIDNMLYITLNNLYLSGKRSVKFKDNYLILKSCEDNCDSDYNVLYFIKS